jgi:hypothetical protein
MGSSLIRTDRDETFSILAVADSMPSKIGVFFREFSGLVIPGVRGFLQVRKMLYEILSGANAAEVLRKNSMFLSIGTRA